MKQRRLKTKKDILIPAGTIFKFVLPGTKYEFGYHIFSTDIELTTNSIGEVYYFFNPEDYDLDEFFMEV